MPCFKSGPVLNRCVVTPNKDKKRHIFLFLSLRMSTSIRWRMCRCSKREGSSQISGVHENSPFSCPCYQLISCWDIFRVLILLFDHNWVCQCLSLSSDAGKKKERNIRPINQNVQIKWMTKKNFFLIFFLRSLFLIQKPTNFQRLDNILKKKPTKKKRIFFWFFSSRSPVNWKSCIGS